VPTGCGVLTGCGGVSPIRLTWFSASPTACALGQAGNSPVPVSPWAWLLSVPPISIPEGSVYP
jgi:hypothetical protein